MFGGSKGGAQREEPSHGSLPGEKVGCVVLTVGVNIGDSRGGFAFEKDMRRLYGCEVHVFDAAAGASGPSEDLGEDLSDDDGGMAFTAGVSLAATSTAPSRHNKMRHTINGGGLDAGSSSFDGTTDEDDDEEFRGETNDDDGLGLEEPQRKKLKSRFLLSLRRRVLLKDRARRDPGYVRHDPVRDDRAGDARVDEGGV